MMATKAKAQATNATAASIAFQAVVYKVQTLVDGGVRVTLDLPETAIAQMAQLAECQRMAEVLHVEAKPC